MRVFFIGLQFLTHISWVKQEHWTIEDFAKSVRYFPLVGLVLGLHYCMLVFLIDICVPYFFQVHIPEHAATFFLVGSMLFLTGGIHADGLMDTLDGILSGRDRERMLEIMKDSRSGMFGIVGFVLFFFAEYVLLLDMGTGLQRLLALLLAPFVARIMLVYVISFFPYARLEGLGKAFSMGGSRSMALCSVVYGFCLSFFLGVAVFYGLIHLGWVIPYEGMDFVAAYSEFLAVLFLLLLTMSHIFATYVTGLLGGLTGDVYGATVMLAELGVIFLFFCVSMVV